MPLSFLCESAKPYVEKSEKAAQKSVKDACSFWKDLLYYGKVSEKGTTKNF